MNEEHGLNGLEEQDKEILRQFFERGQSHKTYVLSSEKTVQQIQIQGALTRRYLRGLMQDLAEALLTEEQLEQSAFGEEIDGAGAAERIRRYVEATSPKPSS